MPTIDTFEPSSLNIRDLFCDGNVAYKVPDYQRRYNWGSEQFEALWDDLYESFQNNRQECYFLGSIVVVKNTNNVFELVDGQQRLTTLMIMIAVLEKTFKDLNCPNPDNPEDESSTIDNETLERCLFFKKGKRRLTLQTAVEYDSEFGSIVIDTSSFSALGNPTKEEKKSERPVYHFKSAAKFFYDRFTKLEEGDRNRFVFYIFNKVKLIRIICENLSFAIKLFQVMNDRGMPLAAADLVKSYIMGRIEEDGDSEDLKKIFTSNWKDIETLVSDHGLRMDDFLVCYEYYKLKSNPKRQVVDELKDIINDKDIDIKEIIDEMKSFSMSLDKVLSSTDPTIYSLFYIPWSTYVTTCLTVAIHVKYGVSLRNENGIEKEDDTEQKRLFFLMRRYFYLAFVSGRTLSYIKQTSFNLLAAIANRKPLSDIEKILGDSIARGNMIKGTYAALNGDVYDERFLKPSLLSVEYANREVTNTTFVPIDKELHVDHILPKAFANNKDWAHVDNDEGRRYLNRLGNMALLYCKKNKEALNRGFAVKCKIYQGMDEEGRQNHSGATSFDTTREITDVYEKEHRPWDIQDIQRRHERQLRRIEHLLGINEEMIEPDLSMSDVSEAQSKKAPRFNFADLGILPGTTLSWYNDPSLTCEVVGDHEVLYQGEHTSLSKIASDKNGYNVNGALYFVYKGKTIAEIRRGKETEPVKG